MSSDHIRAFLALNFPVPVVRRLAEEVRVVQPAVAAAGVDVAWVPATNVHLTLKFLGAIPAPSVEAIRTTLRDALAARPSFELEVRGLGAFPDLRQPRILWAGVKPHAGLAALQKDVEQWMESLGCPREERPFHPHLTLGRIKQAREGATSLEPSWGTRADTLYGAGRITEVVLYESRTLRTGAEYVALARASLRGGARSDGNG